MDGRFDSHSGYTCCIGTMVEHLLPTTQNMHSGMSVKIRESNHGLGVCKKHYA